MKRQPKSTEGKEGKVKREEEVLKQEHQKARSNIKMESFRQVDYDQISDDQPAQNLGPQIKQAVMSQKKPRNEDDIPLSIRVKDYMNKLKLGRKPVEIINPARIGDLGQYHLYLADGIGKFIIPNNQLQSVLYTSPAEEALYKQWLGVTVLHPAEKEYII